MFIFSKLFYEHLAYPTEKKQILSLKGFHLDNSPDIH